MEGFTETLVITVRINDNTNIMGQIYQRENDNQSMKKSKSFTNQNSTIMSTTFRVILTVKIRQIAV